MDDPALREVCGSIDPELRREALDLRIHRDSGRLAQLHALIAAEERESQRRRPLVVAWGRKSDQWQRVRIRLPAHPERPSPQWTPATDLVLLLDGIRPPRSLEVLPRMDADKPARGWTDWTLLQWRRAALLAGASPSLEEWRDIVRAVRERIDGAKGRRFAGDDSRASATATHINRAVPDRVRRAGAAAEWAMIQRPEWNWPHDAAAIYALISEDECPAYPEGTHPPTSQCTFDRYVRDFRRSTYGPVHSRRGGRSGRSIVSQADL